MALDEATRQAITQHFRGGAKKDKKTDWRDYISEAAGVAGTIIGSVIAPGVGTVGGAGLGSSLGNVLERIAKGGVSNIDPLSAVGEGLFGAATAGIGGTLLGGGAKTLGTKIAGKQAAETLGTEVLEAGTKKGLGSQAQKLGLTLGKGSVSPQVAPGLGSLAREEDVVRGMVKEGILGLRTPNQMRASVAKINAKLSDDITKALQGQPARPLKPIKDTLAKTLKTTTEFDAADPMYGRLIKRNLNVLNNYASKGKITPEKLFRFKQDLNKDLGRAFEKIAKGGNPTAAEEVKLAIRGVIDTLISSEYPMVKSQTLRQSILHTAEKGLEKQAAKSATIPFTNIRIPGVMQAGTALQGGASKALLNIGEGAASLSPLGQGVAGASGLMAGELLTARPETGSAGIDPARLLEAPPSPEPTMGGIDDDTLLRIIALDLAESGGKNIGVITQLAELLGGGPKTAEEKKAAMKQGQGMAIADQIAQAYSLAGGGAGRIAGLGKRGAGALGLDAESSAYEALRQASIGPLARLVSGEVGVLTDRDIKRAEGLLPKLTDTPEEAELKLMNLYAAIEGRGGGSSAEDDILGLLAGG